MKRGHEFERRKMYVRCWGEDKEDGKWYNKFKK